MARPVYDSYDPFYKTPFGAVAAGQPVQLRLAVPTEMGVRAPVLFLMADGQNREQARTLAMLPAWQEDGCDIFACTLQVDIPGLYFYFFDLYRDYQKVFQEDFGRCVVTTEDRRAYQLSVYDPAVQPDPAWLGGVMYQIFPDRFFEGQPDKTMPFSDRIYRTDKYGQPYFWPNEKPDGYLNMDYFGGDLAGIRQKLPYLAGLGVTCLYLNPIFEAHANHRYNTADYLNIDPVLGTNEDFEALCRDAHAAGIRVLLDGVFSHTGADSIYFDKYARYGTRGAWQNPDSPWRSWYVFDGQYDCGYRSWWGFTSLPEVNEDDPGYREFICGENGVVRTWLRRGADGWRLDVADELPDSFIADIRRAVKAEGDDKFLLGEVWEDASTKYSGGGRRNYLWGQELDTVMNYPWRNAVLDFIRNGDGVACARSLLEICDHYPPAALHTLMNLLGTHDTERAVTALAGEPSDGRDRQWQSVTQLTPAARAAGIRQLGLAFRLLFFLPGNPCIYYGDEIAMEGYRDPFNRGYFNWEDPLDVLRNDLRLMAARRRVCPALRDGMLQVLHADWDCLALLRVSGSSQAVLAINRGSYTPFTVQLPWGGSLYVGPQLSAFASTD